MLLLILKIMTLLSSLLISHYRGLFAYCGTTAMEKHKFQEINAITHLELEQSFSRKHCLAHMLQANDFILLQGSCGLRDYTCLHLGEANYWWLPASLSPALAMPGSPWEPEGSQHPRTKEGATDTHILLTQEAAASVPCDHQDRNPCS